ncbi:MAG: DUF4340 domain-containing protein [Eubacterium sp.]|nr:DUF4340 domain-containing protein [Eubacterium sp.]
MNKQIKQMKIMLVILVLVIICVAGVMFYNKTQSDKEAASEAEKTLCEIDSADITAFSYMLDGSEYSFALEDEAWVYEGDSSLSISTDAVEEMLSAVSAVAYTEVVEDAEDLSSYGLDEPTNVITITTADETYVFTIGDKNAITYDYYMLYNDDDTIYTVSSDLTDAFSASLDDLLEDASE